MSLKALTRHTVRANAQILTVGIASVLLFQALVVMPLRCGDKFGARANVFAAH